VQRLERVKNEGKNNCNVPSQFYDQVAPCTSFSICAYVAQIKTTLIKLKRTVLRLCPNFRVPSSVDGWNRPVTPYLLTRYM
jgi:hypothetical protein